jgi:hypothetical protein
MPSADVEERMSDDEPGNYRARALESIRELFRQSSHLELVTQDGESVELESIERDDEPLVVFPDGERHERRIQRVISTERDRVFWTSVTIACGSPDKADRSNVDDHGNFEKRFGSLPAARNDIDAFREYYQPTQIGWPHMRMFEGYSQLCAGYYEQTIRLDNPTASEVFAALAQLRHWIQGMQTHAHYKSHQINFCFSGHGVVSGARGGGAAILLADRAVGSAELAAHLLEQPPGISLPVRLDLYLDCCHSGAIAQALVSNLRYAQQERTRGSETVVEPGQVYCACLDDEVCYEFPELSHGVFTFAFLNECSRRRPEGSAERNLGLRDVGWYTGGRQHPVLLDFAATNGLYYKFPSMYYLTHPPRADLRVGDNARPEIDPFLGAVDPVGEVLRAARVYRARCLTVERAICDDSTLRKDFDRAEVRANDRFPFL